MKPFVIKIGDRRKCDRAGPTASSHRRTRDRALRPSTPDDWEALFAVASDPLDLGSPSGRMIGGKEPVFRAYFDARHRAAAGR